MDKEEQQPKATKEQKKIVMLKILKSIQARNKELKEVQNIIINEEKHPDI